MAIVCQQFGGQVPLIHGARWNGFRQTGWGTFRATSSSKPCSNCGATTAARHRGRSRPTGSKSALLCYVAPARRCACRAVGVDPSRNRNLSPDGAARLSPGGGGNACHDLIRDRVASLREEKIAGVLTIAEFMERRLAPAMRRCNSVTERERAVLARIARAGAMLDTRIKVADEAPSGSVR